MNILVVGAGGPAGVNTCRALVKAGHTVFATDNKPEHLGWAFAVGALPFKGGRDAVEDRIDVVVPQPDPLVLELAADQAEWGAAVFLPSLETVETCQSKRRAAKLWHQRGLREPTFAIVEPYPDTLHLAADQLGLPFWLRANRGAGANKAIKVDRLDTAYHWLRFWQSRGFDGGWNAEQFLPGRDLAWTSIWYLGKLVTSFLRERVEYLYPHLSPEGLTGTPTISRILDEPATAAAAENAVLVVDPEPHGIFSVDLREDEHGNPTPTEINAGRGFTTMGLWSLAGDTNFSALAAELAVADGRIPDPQIDPLPAGLTLHRHIDCAAVFLAPKDKPPTPIPGAPGWQGPA